MKSMHHKKSAGHYLLLLLTFLLVGFNGYSQGVEVNGTTNLNLSGTVKINISGVNNDLKMESSSGISGASGNALSLEGSILSTVSDLNYNGQFHFKGSSPAELDFSGTIHKLIVENSGGVTVLQPVTISNEIVLTSGLLSTANEGDLTFPENALLQGNANSFIEGPLSVTVSGIGDKSLFFPVGKSGEYKPVTLNFSQDVAATTTYTAELFTSGIPTLGLGSGNLDKVSTSRYWVLKNGGTPIQSASIVLPVAEDDNVASIEQARIAKEDNGNWKDLGGINLEQIPGSITSSLSFTDLGAFVIANADNSSPIPRILSILPAQGSEGDTITIKGNFLGESEGQIKLGETTLEASHIISWATNEIKIIVPDGLTGKVNVEITVEGGAAPIPFDFQFSIISKIDPCISFTLSTTGNAEFAPVGSSTEIFSTVSDALLVTKAELYIRGISEKNWRSPISPSENENKFFFNLTPEEDEIGYEFYFRYELDGCDPDSTSINLIYIEFPNGKNLSHLRPGDKISDYHIFSVPYQLDNAAVSAVLEGDLGTYDDTKWRLFRVQNSDYQEYKGFSGIDPGRGYIMIFNVTGKTLNTGSGKTLKVTKAQPFTLSLQKGWNMIGSPYPFNLSWEGVLSENGSTENLENFKILSNGAYTNPTTPILEAYKGAIWFSDEATQVTIPVIKDESVNGRLAARELKENPIDHEDWEVRFQLKNENGLIGKGGLGMNPKSSTTKDNLDAMMAPRLGEFLDMHFPHEEFFYPYFAKDIVQNEENYIWEFTVEGSSDTRMVSLEWDNSYFGESDFNLYLYDLENEVRIDMSAQTTYSFNYADAKKFKVYYGIGAGIIPDKTAMGDCYPNPGKDQIHFPFNLSSNNQFYQVSIDIYDQAGRLSRHLTEENFQQGFHEMVWDRKDANGNDLAPGLYIYKLNISGNGENIQFNKKLILE